jgi:ferrous-iron efflux pump FieF
MVRATYAAVATALFLVIIKSAAFVWTGSVALLGSLVDSFLDAVASAINLVAVREALQPADREHRFGHGKAEALAGLGQSAFISGSAMFLAFESLMRLFRPVPISQSVSGIVVVVISIAATIALVFYQRHVIRQTKSVAISADSLHYTGDLLVNMGVIAALVLAGRFGLLAVDSVIGLLIAGFIGYSALSIVRTSYDQLMDRELPDSERARIREIAISHKEVRAMHDLRTRASGTNLFIQLHLELDPQLRLVQAHDIADQVEDEITQAFPGAEVLIHQDPVGQEEPPHFPARK